MPTHPTSRRPLFIAAWLIYSLVLTTATHWPGVVIDGPVPRTDMWIHTAAFGIWTALALASGIFGPGTRIRPILFASLAALAFAAFDEGSQAIPIFKRVAAWDDFAANCLGVLLATLGALGGALSKPDRFELRG